MQPETGSELTVTRSFDGAETRIAVEGSSGAYQGAAAEARLIDLVWRDATSASNSQKALAGVLTRSVYLQQDVIREFVEAASDEERFQAVSELIGAGRVTDLQASLERAKKAWSTVTNQRQEELRPLKDKLATIEARLSELRTRQSPSSLIVTAEAWAEWWTDLRDSGIQSMRVELSSREAPGALDAAINELNAKKLAAERRLEQLRSLQSELADFAAKPDIALAAMIETVAAGKQQLENLKAEVVNEQERLSLLRSQQAALQEKSEQLRTLAILALENLGEHCPVCAQTYDRQETERRLNDLAKSALSEGELAIDQSTVGELLVKVASKEKELASAEVALRSQERLASDLQTRRQKIDDRLGELGIEALQGNRNEAVNTKVDETRNGISRLLELQGLGESIAARLAQSSGQALAEELDREAQVLRNDTGDREQQISARNRSGDLAQRVIEALREASSSVVQERLNEISPLLQSIYSRVDPHPSFRMVKFLARIVRGKGHLSTVVSDPLEDKESALPSTILSSSQLNALAVAVFLSLNIGIRQPPLPIAIMDDPLQSLDDINLLGLVDLLRRTKAQRQLLVSTHDSRFGSLLSRKLRPTHTGERTTVIELEGWSRRGPDVKVHDVSSDPVPLRLVAS